jgi:hypothetical protein
MRVTDQTLLQASIDRLMDLAEDQYVEWAACKDKPEGWFFGPEGPGEPDLTNLGKQVCAGCPTYIECLDSALTHDPEGVRAGYDEAERVKIDKRRKKYAVFFKHDLKSVLA